MHPKKTKKRTKWKRRNKQRASTECGREASEHVRIPPFERSLKAKTAFIPGLCTVYQWQQRRARHNRPVSRAAPTEPPLGGAWASSLSAVRNILKPGNLKSPNRRNASGRLPTQLPEEARTVMRRCASLRLRRRQSELLGTATESTFGCARSTTTNTMLSAAKFKIIYETCLQLWSHTV